MDPYQLHTRHLHRHNLEASLAFTLQTLVNSHQSLLALVSSALKTLLATDTAVPLPSPPPYTIRIVTGMTPICKNDTGLARSGATDTSPQTSPWTSTTSSLVRSPLSTTTSSSSSSVVKGKEGRSHRVKGENGVFHHPQFDIVTEVDHTYAASSNKCLPYVSNKQLLSHDFSNNNVEFRFNNPMYDDYSSLRMYSDFEGVGASLMLSSLPSLEGTSSMTALSSAHPLSVFEERYMYDGNSWVTVSQF